MSRQAKAVAPREQTGRRTIEARCPIFFFLVFLVVLLGVGFRSEVPLLHGHIVRGRLREVFMDS